MARKGKKEVKPKNPVRWTLRDVEEHLKANGAVEIPTAMLVKEPYKTYMKNVKRNGKFICD